ENGFRLLSDETLADVLRRYEDVAAETEATIRSIDDLDRPVPVPKGVPWYPDDVEAWSVRWVLLHVIEETARRRTRRRADRQNQYEPPRQSHDLKSPSKAK
ncbi:MAG: DUF664 domain-containing protein, partial [Rhodomicrobium sp.]|nr:DUF664 domain-containing protein [Rhodomicrobium sp.]